jgi:glycosyltransferase involved in cell wall biosynthesis
MQRRSLTVSLTRKVRESLRPLYANRAYLYQSVSRASSSLNSTPVGMSVAPAATTRLLLELSLPFRRVQNVLCMEEQAQLGIRRWLENFDHVTLCAPLAPEAHVEPTMQWVPVADLRSDRFQVQPLPWSYHPFDHWRDVGQVRQIMRTLIPQHTHLCFSGLGWLGCWGRIGCEESRSLSRRYAVWLDWVLHAMPARKTSGVLRRGWSQLQLAMVKKLSLRDVAGAALGLFNGKTVYDGYVQYCKVPRIAHNVHLQSGDLVTSAQLEQRRQRRQSSINIVCASRVHEMKGPHHWLEAVRMLTAEWRGAQKLHAAWLGGGPLLTQMRSAVASQGLSQEVEFAGHQADHGRVLQTLRAADLFLFCNLTPESPRVLIEALMSGLPIIGFETEFAKNLLGKHTAGGAFVPMGDTAALARLLGQCLSDPARLEAMTAAAQAAGQLFSEESVFRQRSDYIKQLA